MFPALISGAGRRIRTDDLLITNQLLYQLSYAGLRKGEPDTTCEGFMSQTEFERGEHSR